jgi:hypothetical protein
MTMVREVVRAERCARTKNSFMNGNSDDEHTKIRERRKKTLSTAIQEFAEYFELSSIGSGNQSR